MEASGQLVLRLAGQVRLVGAGGTDLTPRGAKTQGILVLVGSAPSLRRTRAFLQDKLWSDRGAEQGSASLRQSLVELRRCLGEHRDCLIADAHMVALDRERVRVVMTPDADDWGPLRETPEFAEGLDIVDPEFEGWIRDQRMAFADWMANEPRRPPETRDEPLPPPPAGPSDSKPEAPAAGAERPRPPARPLRRLPLTVALLLIVPLSFLGLRYALSTDLRDVAGAERAAVVSGPSIVVLPFESVASDPEQRGFARVAAREIVTNLAQFPHLFVVDADAILDSAPEPGAGPVAALKLGRELGVRYVLRGLVQRTDGLIRANIQLIKTDNGRTEWATWFEGDAKAAYAVQGEIARGVVTNLEPILIPACGTLASGTVC